MTIDWIKVSEHLLSSILTLIVSLLSILFHNRIQTFGNKKRDEHLFELAALRTQAVALRNKGEKYLTEEVQDEWLTDAIKIEKAILAKAREISPVLAERLRTHDRIMMSSISLNSPNPKIINRLGNLNSLIQRVELFLSKYQF
ncbi:MAG: hypothetical protein JXA97_09360 [Anaerolineales bacterium]|nr:hypothetical protein [Anaerolineales bacterium]